MKLLISTAIMAIVGTAAMAETKIINGCEVRKAENGSYFYKVNPGCVGTLGAYIKASGEDALNERAKEREEAALKN